MTEIGQSMYKAFKNVNKKLAKEGIMSLGPMVSEGIMSLDFCQNKSEILNGRWAWERWLMSL